MRANLLASLVPLLLCAQPQEPAQSITSTRIHGVVLDVGTGQPIPDAEVSLTPGRNFQLPLKPDARSVNTEVDGRFQFENLSFGPYALYATKPGYQPGPGQPQFVAVNSSPVEAQLMLVKESSVSGRVVDRETAEPLAGIEVRAIAVTYREGRAIPRVDLITHRSVTDPDGVFHIGELLEGRYYLELMAQDLAPRVAAGAPPTIPGAGYRRQWWPSGREPDLSQWVQLHSGVDLRTPDVPMDRLPLLHVTGTIRFPEGEPGPCRIEVLRHRTRHGLTTDAAGVVPCGERYSVLNLSPGPVSLIATAGEAITETRVQIAGESFDLDLQALPLLRIPGIVRVPEGFRTATGTVRVLPDGQNTGVLATGPGYEFELKVRQAEEVDIRVNGLEAPYYVQEVLYLGSPVNGTTLLPQPFAVQQQLEIVVAEDGAAITGGVRAEDQAVAGAMVIAVPQPLRTVDGFPRYAGTVTNGEGQFSIPGLAPGTYRIVSVTKEAWEDEVQRPGVLAALVLQGTAVDVAPRAAQVVDLELEFVATH